MTVDSAGRLFFETGPAESGIVARLDADGRVSRLVTGLAHPSRRQAATRPSGASRLAPDGEGGVLIAAGGQVVRIAANNAASIVAGAPSASPERRANGGDGTTGDGGPAATTRFAGAQSIATDQAGNLYVADQIDGRFGTVRIRLVNRSNQTITVYPGTPDQLMIPPGTIQTIAGAPGRTGNGDGGPARRAVLQGVPPAMAVVGERLYVASSWVPPGLTSTETAQVRLVNLGGMPMKVHGVSIPAGSIETVAGGGPLGHGGDGGPARSAEFSRLPGIAADSAGNLFLADELNNRVRKVDSAGVVATVAGRAGTGRQNAGYNGNDQPATRALLNRPVDVEVGPGERIYVSDRANRQIRVIDRTGTIRAAPGRGIGQSWICAKRAGASASASPPETPQPGGPTGIAADDRGNVYIANADTQQVIRVDRAGEAATIVGRRRGDRTCLRAGSCPAVGDGGPAVDAELVRPTAVEFMPDGAGLYVFDTVRVRFINLSARTVTVQGTKVAPGAIQTVAGNGTPGSGGDGGKATEAQLGAIQEQHFESVGLAVDRDGTLLVADPANARVRQIGASGVITTFAGTGAAGERATCCTDPVGLALGLADEVYVADLGRDDISRPHPRVWLVNRGSDPVSALGQRVGPGAVQPVAGSGSGALGFDGDGGRAVDAQLLRLSGIALDRAGQLYISGVGQQEVDRNSQLVGGEGEVRKVDAKGAITWLMGNGQSGFNGDGLKPRLTSLNSPSDVAVDPCGNLLVADRGNDRVRRLNMMPCRTEGQDAAESHESGGRRGRTMVPLLAIVATCAVVALLAFWLYRGSLTNVGDGD